MSGHATCRVMRSRRSWILTAGVYSFNSSAHLADNGTLTLDGQGNPNSVFIIVIGSALTTASNSKVVFINGAQAGNVYFVVGSSATLGTHDGSTGRSSALTSITLDTGAIITCGAALAARFKRRCYSRHQHHHQSARSVLATVTDTLGSGAYGRTQQWQSPPRSMRISSPHGSLPAAFQNLLDFLSPDQLAAALNQLSGQTATGAAPTGCRRWIRSCRRCSTAAFADDQGSPQPAPNQPPRTVKALGYATRSSRRQSTRLSLR